MEPADIARRLFAFASEIEASEIEVDDWTFMDQLEGIWLDEFKVRERLQLPAEALIAELREALAATDWNPDLSDIPQSERIRWALGEAITLKGSEREVHRGFLVPRRKLPLLRRIPDEVALYLIAIDEGEDYLKRENHGMGYHYHYLNWRKERSNIVLSWDTRWQDPDPKTDPPSVRPLFVEPHGEAGNADFKAKPWLWRDKKRKSIYDACSPDLSKWPAEAFKCASNDSEIVYPPGYQLTPQSAAIAHAVAKAKASARRAKNKRGR